jgi:hypothetical protein
VELEQWIGPLEVPFDLLHARIERLVGRPVWTHELANPEALVREIRAGKLIPFSEVVTKLGKELM